MTGGVTGGNPGPRGPSLPTSVLQADSRPASFNGSFTQRYPIAVPAFRGLEPDLALVYDSASGFPINSYWAGLVGHGFRLDGISEIERITRFGGAPRIDGTDTYSLDGAELFECAATTAAASCEQEAAVSGMRRFSTRYESHRRIRYFGATNSFEVTDRDGTRSVYMPLSAYNATHPTEPGLVNNVRWLLRDVIDTRGNKVTYSYTCARAPVCWPEAIVYNGKTINNVRRFETRIVFHYTTTTGDQVLTRATGRDLATLDRRIAAMTVTVDGQTRSIDAFTYGISPATAVSRLVSVQRYGTNAVRAANGTITGTALPALRFSYQGEAFRMETGTDTRLVTPINEGKSRFLGDYDRDGAVDLFQAFNNSTLAAGVDGVLLPVFTCTGIVTGS